MKLKKNITLISIIFFVCFMSGCSSIKKTLSGGSEKNTDEFLVKKKDPLVLPPEFNDLPKPQKQKTSFSKCGSNDAQGHCDEFCTQIVKIGPILGHFWLLQSLCASAK